MTTNDQAAVTTSDVIRRWAGAIGAIAAPLTLVTAVCFYFGSVYTRANFLYFGVDPNALGLTSTDYVLSSVSVLYAPLMALALGAAIIVCARTYSARLLGNRKHPHLAGAVVGMLLVTGTVLAVLGLLGVLLPRMAVVGSANLTPTILCTGTLLIVAGCWIASTAGTFPLPPREVCRAMSLLAGAIIVLAVFWITNIFATAYGQQQARETASRLWDRQVVVVIDTTTRLFPPNNLVLESGPIHESPTSDAIYRYECFRQIFVYGDRWVLVPARWTPQNGYAVLVGADKDTRISVFRYKDNGENNADFDSSVQCPEVA